MKEILVAAERDQADESWQPVEIPIRDAPKDGEKEGELRILIAQPPGSGQLAAFMATNASFASNTERVAGAINFLVSVLTDADHSYIVSRLFDGKDAFGTDQVQGIIEGLLEEWTGRPTKSPSASTPSRRTAGPKSTRRTPALT